jgi:hypothetical protein
MYPLPTPTAAPAAAPAAAPTRRATAAPDGVHTVHEHYKNMSLPRRGRKRTVQESSRMDQRRPLYLPRLHTTPLSVLPRITAVHCIAVDIAAPAGER